MCADARRRLPAVATAATGRRRDFPLPAAPPPLPSAAPGSARFPREAPQSLPPALPAPFATRRPPPRPSAAPTARSGFRCPSRPGAASPRGWRCCADCFPNLAACAQPWSRFRAVAEPSECRQKQICRWQRYRGDIDSATPPSGHRPHVHTCPDRRRLRPLPPPPLPRFNTKPASSSSMSRPRSLPWRWLQVAFS